jgi:putative two-component system response regulator
VSKRSILVVDDESGNLAMLRQILEDSYSLIFARSGAEALAAARKHLPSLILLDVQMPDMDGYAVCRHLKSLQLTREIPVIFVSTRSSVGDESAGFEAGGVDYIVKPVSATIVRARVRAHLSLVQTKVLEDSYRAAILMLSHAGHFNDADTGDHIWRMAAYSKVLAQAFGWSPERCDMLELAAPMHDTGKLGIPHNVLLKPGPLNTEEREIMKGHSMIGYKILSKSEAPVFKLAAEIALYHHERWDGTGYPEGLAGTDIPESARIVALADVFDALSMRRPYKEPWPIERIMEHLRNGSGSHFDPEMANLFIEAMPQLLEIREAWERRLDEPETVPDELQIKAA